MRVPKHAQLIPVNFDNMDTFSLSTVKCIEVDPGFNLNGLD